MKKNIAVILIQTTWRERLLKKQIAYEMLRTKNKKSLLVCEQYFTGVERYQNIPDLLASIGKELSFIDRIMSDSLNISQEHENYILAYDILATRFNLNSIDELQVRALFL
tara:strand:- start:142 stop:471 length:330 start_codon:yes stop_codon:yes gene_type:complete